MRRLAEQFHCGRTQIWSILKNKESILELYEPNASSSSICMRKRAQSSEFSEIMKRCISGISLGVIRIFIRPVLNLVRKQEKLHSAFMWKGLKPPMVG